MHSGMIVGFAAVLLLCWSSAVVAVSDAAGLHGLPFTHRFSGELKEKALRAGSDWPYPEVNTPEYHQFLIGRDVVRHGRKLAAVSQRSLTFAEGNLTNVYYDGLQYVVVDVGTPRVPFYVALDTGSDLFWLPCECKVCAPAAAPSPPGGPFLGPQNVYAPSKSTSSKEISCGSSNCSAALSTCPTQNTLSTEQCSYLVTYGSPNTSTSGTLYQDVIYLTPDSGAGSAVASPIVLGCGDNQTGEFDSGDSVTDGLLGLGLQSFAVPSLLAKSGIVGNSFSMCFDLTMSGRIVFGNFGGPNLASTPFQPSPPTADSHYYVGVTSITTGTKSTPFNGTMIFDTGTSLTYLETTTFKAVIAAYASQVTNYPRTTFNNIAPYDLCYATSNASVETPDFNFTLFGGSEFAILAGAFVPYFFTNETFAGFCLGLLDGGTTNIFGVNFMLGYNLIFDREESKLAFQKEDCYQTQAFANSTGSSSPVLSPVQAPVISPILGPGGITLPPPPGGSGPQNSSASGLCFSLLPLFSLGLVVNFLIK